MMLNETIQNDIVFRLTFTWTWTEINKVHSYGFLRETKIPYSCNDTIYSDQQNRYELYLLQYNILNTKQNSI